MFAVANRPLVNYYTPVRIGSKALDVRDPYQRIGTVTEQNDGQVTITFGPSDFVEIPETYARIIPLDKN
jgi:hypothetical protein